MISSQFYTAGQIRSGHKILLSKLHFKLNSIEWIESPCLSDGVHKPLCSPREN